MLIRRNQYEAELAKKQEISLGTEEACRLTFPREAVQPCWGNPNSFTISSKLDARYTSGDPSLMFVSVYLGDLKSLP